MVTDAKELSAHWGTHWWSIPARCYGNLTSMPLAPVSWVPSGKSCYLWYIDARAITMNNIVKMGYDLLLANLAAAVAGVALAAFLRSRDQNER